MQKEERKKHWIQAGFTVEASILIPFICFLLAVLVQMIFYLHDTSVFASAAYTAAQRAVEANDLSLSQREKYAEKRAEEFLYGRCLAAREYRITANAGSNRVRVLIEGSFGFWRGTDVQVEKEVLFINSVDYLRNVKKAAQLWSRLE